VVFDGVRDDVLAEIRERIVEQFADEVAVENVNAIEARKDSPGASISCLAFNSGVAAACPARHPPSAFPTKWVCGVSSICMMPHAFASVRPTGMVATVDAGTGPRCLRDKEDAVLDTLRLTPELKARHEIEAPGESFLASMGIYVFNRDLVRELLDNPLPDFGKHIIPNAIKNHPVYSYVYQGYWEDVGTNPLVLRGEPGSRHRTDRASISST